MYGDWVWLWIYFAETDCRSKAGSAFALIYLDKSRVCCIG